MRKEDRVTIFRITVGLDEIPEVLGQFTPEERTMLEKIADEFRRQFVAAGPDGENVGNDKEGMHV